MMNNQRAFLGTFFLSFMTAIGASTPLTAAFVAGTKTMRTKSRLAMKEPMRESEHQSNSFVSSFASSPCSRRNLFNNLISASSKVGTTTATATALAGMIVTGLPLGPSEALALSPTQASSAYDRYAGKYDQLDGGEMTFFLGLDRARTQLFSKATGDVAEVGVGTGLNLSKYDFSKITSLTLIDVSEGMLQEAKAKAATYDTQIPIRFVQADATNDLVAKFGHDRFDTVVDSFSLCVMGDRGARACVQQLSDITKCDGGRVLLLENTRSSNSLLGMYQDATADAAAAAGGKGCVYNQNVGAMIRDNPNLNLEKEVPFVSGLFRSFECTKRACPPLTATDSSSS